MEGGFILRCALTTICQACLFHCLQFVYFCPTFLRVTFLFLYLLSCKKISGVRVKTRLKVTPFAFMREKTSQTKPLLWVAEMDVKLATIDLENCHNLLHETPARVCGCCWNKTDEQNPRNETLMRSLQFKYNWSPYHKPMPSSPEIMQQRNYVQGGRKSLFLFQKGCISPIN